MKEYLFRKIEEIIKENFEEMYNTIFKSDNHISLVIKKSTNNMKGIIMNINEVINGWTFEETMKIAENFMEAEKDIFKWDVMRHLKNFAETYRKQLKEYLQLEKQGRLVKLPCKIGTEVYDITWWDDVQEKVIVEGKAYYRTVHKHKISKSTFHYFDIDEFGKTIFLTKEEAEAKLKELSGRKEQ